VRIVCLAVPLVAWLAAIDTRAGGPAQDEPTSAGRTGAAASGLRQQEGPALAGADMDIGAARCGECHAPVHRKWTGARHSKMLQPASPATVIGDFSQGAITLRGARYTLERQGESFAVRGPFPTPRSEAHRVDFTLGSRRVQHYLTRLPDGRIVVLPPAWDVERREWFHNLDIVNPDEASFNPVQVWNSNCFGCHVSGEEKRFDAERLRYDTRWTDFGTNCERCHGPGAAHAARYAPAQADRPGPSAIVVPTRLTTERSTMICAQCHSLRDITVPGFTAGDDYFDYFTPVLEYGQKTDKDLAYWPDGRPRRFSNDAIGFWQSRCFLSGKASCTTCHADPHEPDVDRNPDLVQSSNDLCTRCHDAVAAEVPRHTRHAAESTGSSCIACHMPRTVVGLRASRMADHTIGVPAPENTVRHGIPNACTECHEDKDPAWAAGALAEWYPNGRRRLLIARADAFAAARRRDPAALDQLLAVAGDPDQPPLARANALGYLRYFPGPRAEAALAEAAASGHTAMRLTAALGLGERGFSFAGVTPVLIRGLADERRVVRIGAMLSLVNLRVTSLPAGSGRQLEQAKRDYLARADLLSDDPTALLDIGKFHLLNKDADAAARTLEASLRLDGRLHASRYFLALGRLAQGRVAEARELLVKIPKDDAYADAAAKVLASLPPGGSEDD
jgi:predicted CXXCH cytochrome family protein